MFVRLRKHNMQDTCKRFFARQKGNDYSYLYDGHSFFKRCQDLQNLAKFLRWNTLLNVKGLHKGKKASQKNAPQYCFNSYETFNFNKIKIFPSILKFLMFCYIAMWDKI